MELSDIASKIDQVTHYVLFEFNQTPVTPASILMFIVIVLAFYIVARLFVSVLRHRILARFHIDTGIRFMLSRVTHYLIMIVGIVVAFQFVGIDLSGLAVIFGLLSVGLGFGLQNVASNFVSGLILLFERPIQVGDRVLVGDTEGDVQAINMRATTVRSLENISIIVPNSEFISSQVTNWSHGDPKIRLLIDVGVSYNSDLDTVLDALHEAATENPETLNDPAPDVLFRGFGDSSWNLTLRLWIANPRGHHVIRSDINCAIVRKFREKGVEIPFPQRDLHVRSPLPIPFAREATV
jgi:small-conductance mechanosensitive channel